MKVKLFLLILIFYLINPDSFSQQPYIIAGQTGDNISFTDLDPDIMIFQFPEQYLLDIDNNGVPDFTFSNEHIDGPMMSSSFYISIAGNNQNKVLFGEIDSTVSDFDSLEICDKYKIARIFNFGDTIKILKDTCQVAQILFYVQDNERHCNGENSVWCGIGPKFIGLILNRNDSLIFGWVKIEVCNDQSDIAVYEYASEIKHVTQIHDYKFTNSINLYPNPAANEIYIKTSNSVEPFTIELFNLNGKIVLKKVIANQSSSIKLKDSLNGTYVYRITTNREIETGKLIIE